MKLVRSDGTTFASEDACVSCAAQRGALLSATARLTTVVVVNTLDGTGSSMQGFPFSLSTGLPFTLIDDNAGPGVDTLAVTLPVGSYTVGQDGVTRGWLLSGISCSGASDTNLTPTSATVTLASGNFATCTFTYSQVA